MAEPAIFNSLYSSITSYFTPTYLFCFLNLMIGTIFIASNFKSHKEKEEEEEDHQHQLARVPSLLERVKSIDFSLYRSQQSDPTQLEPAPPSLLQRVKSFSLYKDQRPDLHSDHTHYHPDPVHTQQVQVQVQGSGSATDTQYQAPSLLERVKSFSLYNSDQPDPNPDTQNSDQTRLVRYPTLLQRVKSIKLSLYPSDRPDPDSENDPLSDPDHHVTRSKSDKAPARVPAKMRKSASEKNVGPTEEGDDEVDRRRPETVRERKRSETTLFGGEDEGVDAKADDFINKFKQQLKLQRLDSLIRYKEMLNRK